MKKIAVCAALSATLLVWDDNTRHQKNWDIDISEEIHSIIAWLQRNHWNPSGVQQLIDSMKESEENYLIDSQNPLILDDCLQTFPDCRKGSEEIIMGG